MGVTRKEKLLKAMLEDNASACGGGVTRFEKMLAGVAKKTCDNDVLEGGGGGGLPFYWREGGMYSREWVLAQIKAGQPFLCIEPNHEGNSMQIRFVVDFVAMKSFTGEDGNVYPAEIVAWALNGSMDKFIAYSVDNPTDAEVEEVWAAWSAMAKYPE